MLLLEKCEENFAKTNNDYFSELQIRRGLRIIERSFYLFLNLNICCDPSLELPRQDCSNDESQHTFLKAIECK